MLIDGRFFREIAANCWDPALRVADCDRDGVTAQALSTLPVMFSYWARPEDALDLAQRLNDHIAGIVASHPRRFVGLGTVPLQDPERAIREMERCVRDLGMTGLQIGTHVNLWNLNEPALFPFFQAAAELGVPLFVHPWDMLGRDRMQKYWLPWLVGMPTETCIAICSMIFGGVFERLPRLRVAFAHGGGSFPGTIGRIEHGFHARPDLCAVDNAVAPRAYLKRPDGTPARFYVDSLTHDAGALLLLLRLLGEERVALGSDYPFPLGEARPGGLIESLDELAPRTRERLLAGNVLEFLGLSADRFR
jgi:aminocarboxymuconate-semialdehyde decarboxylase